jgi:ribosomal protein S18 acetylase RimI-like enzyme
VAEPNLRPAVAEQAEAVADLARAAYAKYVPRIGRAPAPMVADFPAAIAAGEIHVLLAGRALVGFIVFRNGPDHLFVENIAVHPDWQHRGFGRRLMVFAEATAVARGLPALRLYTNVKMTENMPFYGGLGFVETERRHEEGFDRVYMEKRLA